MRAVPSERLNTGIVAILVLLSVAEVTGCAAPKPMETGPTSEAPNPIRVSQTKLTHTIHFPAGSSAPNAGETRDLNEFLATSSVSSGDVIVIERPDLKTGSALDDKRASRLETALARQGLKPVFAQTPDVAVGEMTLVVERYEATAPNCPNWSKAPGNDFDNTMHSDFGCSTASNLAAMIADPKDLISGKPMGPVVGEPAIAAVERYRSGRVGSISDDSNPGAAQNPAQPPSSPSPSPSPSPAPSPSAAPAQSSNPQSTTTQQ
jgi:pilus assembly protein CpaD